MGFIVYVNVVEIRKRRLNNIMAKLKLLGQMPN